VASTPSRGPAVWQNPPVQSPVRCLQLAAGYTPKLLSHAREADSVTGLRGGAGGQRPQPQTRTACGTVGRITGVRTFWQASCRAGRIPHHRHLPRGKSGGPAVDIERGRRRQKGRTARRPPTEARSPSGFPHRSPPKPAPPPGALRSRPAKCAGYWIQLATDHLVRPGAIRSIRRNPFPTGRSASVHYSTDTSLTSPSSTAEAATSPH